MSKRIIKNCTKVLAFYIITMFVMNGYSQNNKCPYPENPVKDKTITREDFLKIESKGEQRMVYMTLTGECQYQLWNAKFEELKLLDFSKEELDYIKTFQKFMTDNKDKLFVERNKEMLENFADFTENWRKEVSEKFNWPNELAFMIIADLGSLNNQELKKLKEN